jgi:glycosyltransferase involved in cell wall biosynthesis
LLREALQAGIASYDLVHIHGLWHRPGWDAGRAARAAGIPYVISPRGMLESDAVAIRRFRKVIAFSLVERRNLRSAAALHATSNTELSTLERRRLGPPAFLAPNGIDVEPVVRTESDAILRTYGLTSRDRFVLFLGRIHPIKRLDLLAGAAGLLQTRGTKIVIAGPDERGHRASLEPLFAGSGLATAWVGAVDEHQKRALLGAATALVLCSDSESFGLAVLEAMAVGVPVITTTTVPWQELAAERAGYHVPQTAAAIAEALDDVLRDAPRAAAMGARGRALVERRYTWSIVAQAMVTQYLKLTNARAEGRPRVA